MAKAATVSMLIGVLSVGGKHIDWKRSFQCKETNRHKVIHMNRICNICNITTNKSYSI